VVQARRRGGVSWLAVEVLKGRASSAQLIRFGSPPAPRLMLYDGGGSGTYARALRPRLETLRSEFFGGSPTPLPLDLVAVSHGDDDRIRGVLDLLKELRAAKEERRPPLAQIHEIWFNDFGSLLDRLKPRGPVSGRSKCPNGVTRNGESSSRPVRSKSFWRAICAKMTSRSAAQKAARVFE
jgi:hypothetical protein